MIEDIRRHRAERPRFGYRRLRALLRANGWRVSKETVRRVCREERLKLPPIKPKRRVPGHGPKPGLIASGKGDVWPLDFGRDRTEDGRPLKILAVVDEYTRECLTLIVDRRMRSGRVIETLRELFLVRGAAAAHPQRQLPRADCPATQELTGAVRRGPRLHRAGHAVAERARGLVQWTAAERAAGGGAAVDAGRGAGRDRGLWAGVQPPAAALIAGLRDPRAVRGEVRAGPSAPCRSAPDPACILETIDSTPLTSNCCMKLRQVNITRTLKATNDSATTGTSVHSN